MHPLLPSGASVIVMGSISSLTAYLNESIYCMTKSAVIRLVRGMARELADRRIRIALCPGIVGEAGMSQDAVDTIPPPRRQKPARPSLWDVRPPSRRSQAEPSSSPGTIPPT